jgi:maltooligosyltrehalose trehalohydrolase
MPFGAELRSDGSVRFRLWAPKSRGVELCLEKPGAKSIPLPAAGHGWFELITPEAGAGSLYRFQIDGVLKVPDPASRFQPSDVNGPSEVIDPRAFAWTDDQWQGRPWEEAVIYELHVGTFTPEGTFRGVERKLDYLTDLGVTALELMPLADFAGNRGWGYDGVLPYAPDSSYGRPEDLKHLIDAAHSKKLMVFLDVVYNHFGPEGNYLHAYAPQFFTSRHHTPWGDAINFDGRESRPVREFFINNALYWLEEFHFDGLRLDAVHAIVDDSTPNILTELAQTVRHRVGRNRQVHLVLENADNGSRYLRRDAQNRVRLYTAQWDDDIHHAMHALTTGESDGYYSDYARDPVQKLCRCLTEGFAYQGDFSEYHAEPRGEPSSDLPPTAFVSFLQNHDQIGNRALGERITKLVSPELLRAAMEILLLAPLPPMLFMGEEFGASSPFLFFCDFHGELAAAVTNGRRNEFARFAKFNSPEMRDHIPDPNAEQTFLQSKLDWQSVNCGNHAQSLRLYRELLALRARCVVPHLQGKPGRTTSACDERVRSISVDWQFADGTVLELRANLGEKALRDCQSWSGQVFYSSTAQTEFGEERRLAPYSVVWAVRSLPY